MSEDAGARRQMLEILEPALSDPRAGARRARTLAEDDRSAESIRTAYAGLDAVVELLRRRIEEGGGATEEVRTVEPGDVFELQAEGGERVASRAERQRPITRETPTRPVTKRRQRSEAEVADMARRAAELLYEDVLWLFSINDGEGALVSLERLLNMGSLEGEAAEFLELNADRLLQIYENYLGPFTRIVRRGAVSVEDMPAGYLEQGHLGDVWNLVDGERTIRDVLDASRLPPLTACAALEQLARSRVVSLG
ncbi:MAG: hypothetical protein ACQEXJ_20670 [Myxococcota bacterium]